MVLKIIFYLNRSEPTEVSLQEDIKVTLEVPV